jgi:hypothetical protein
MANVLLVSENKLKSFTNVNKNVDIDTIRAEIGIAQDIHLQTLLGTRFYEHLLSQVSSTGNTFNANELTLVNDYISPFLIQISYFEMLPHLHYRTMNRGVVVGDMESATGVDLGTMQYLRGVQKQRADFYKMRLQDFLITGRGQNLFPDYLTQTTLDGMIADKSDKYNSPIYLNHTSRYGWSNRMLRRSMNSYSERLMSDGPGCWDCQ